MFAFSISKFFTALSLFNQLSAWWAANGAAVKTDCTTIVASVVGLLYLLHTLLLLVAKFFPQAATADNVVCAALRWLDNLIHATPPALGSKHLLSLHFRGGPVLVAKPAVSLVASGAVKALLPLLLLAALSQTACGAAVLGTPVFSHGPSIALAEVQPSNPHPLQLASGAGWQESAGLWQFSFAGNSYDLLDLSAVELGSVVSPAGAPAGALQLGGMVGTAGNIVAVGLVVTPYQAGLPAFYAGWAHPDYLLTLNLLSLVPNMSPPVGVSPGPKALPRGNLATLLQGIFK